MYTIPYDLLDPICDYYIGDELTWEDLQRGFSAFIEDQQTEEEQILMETP